MPRKSPRTNPRRQQTPTYTKSSLPSRPGYDAAARIAADLLSAEVATIFLIDPLMPEYLQKVASTSSLKGPLSLKFTPPRKLGSGLTAFVANWYRQNQKKNTARLYSEKQLQRSPYTSKTTPRHLPSKKNISRLVVPLRDRKNELVGVVVFYNKKPTAKRLQFSSKDVVLANAVREMIESKIAHVGFSEIFKALSRIGAHVDLNMMLGRVLRLAGLLLKADRGDFIGPDRATRHVKSRAQWGPKPTWGFKVGDPVPEGGFMRRLLQAQDKTDDIADDVKQIGKDYYPIDENTLSEVAVKFQTPQGKQYLINLESFKPRFFDEEDVRLIRLLLPFVEARAAQAEGKETIALYKDLIVENLDEMVFVKDVEGRFVFVSSKLAEYFGTSPESVIGKTDTHFFSKHPDMVKSFLATDREVMLHGAKGWYEETCQPDFQGEPRRVNTYKVPVYDSDKIASLMSVTSEKRANFIRDTQKRRVLGVLGIFHDVSKAAYLEQALALGKSGHFVWRKHSNQLHVSESLWQLVGLPGPPELAANADRDAPKDPTKVIMNLLKDQVDPKDLSMLLDTYHALLAKIEERTKANRSYSIKLDSSVVFKLNGTERWLRLSYDNDFEIPADPNSEYVIAILQDVTELQRAQLAKGALLQEAHHRIKNNFATLESVVCRASQGLTDPEAKRTLSETAGRIGSLTILHDLLARPTASGLIGMRDYLTKLLHALQESYHTATTGISCSSEFDDTELTFDQATTCGLVVHDLFANAAKHAFPAEGSYGRITVTLKRSDHHMVTLTVADDGVGLAADFNAESATSLGFWLIKGWVYHQLRGQITVEKTAGTTFTIRFKRILPPA